MPSIRAATGTCTSRLGGPPSGDRLTSDSVVFLGDPVDAMGGRCAPTLSGMVSGTLKPRQRAVNVEGAAVSETLRVPQHRCGSPQVCGPADAVAASAERSERS